MKLDLTRYRRPLDRFERTFPPQELGEASEAYQIVVPVHLAFDIHKDKERFRLEGRVRAELELPCGRCLESFRLPVDAVFDLRYLPATEASTDPDREIDAADLETGYYREDQIDLSDLMREQFYLALPMKPLCQEACRGLCAQCGTNLNETTCDCAPVWEDPRLAPLKALTNNRES